MAAHRRRATRLPMLCWAVRRLCQFIMILPRHRNYYCIRHITAMMMLITMRAFPGTHESTRLFF